ncbi:hydrogenase nickel incorporation protein HypB [Gammaproteobacteria bacterium]
MRFVDEYRAPEQVMQLIEHLRERASHLSYTAERPLRIMEVCGGHTHAIFKFGLDQLLPENVEFIHGPGCPVCVLPMGRIDTCVEIASHPEVIFCTFGDAMRVPGKQGSLLQAKARVGNLVCPASFDLGEKHKVAVLSVTEGEDKPLKYPHMFAAASLMLLNKVDLLPYLNFDVEKCIACAREVNPEIEIILISATSGEGMDQWLNWLETQRCA